jgi:flagellar biosynthesis/type III secretory pathway M-ring protein FliF/YscJ
MARLSVARLGEYWQGLSAPWRFGVLVLPAVLLLAIVLVWPAASVPYKPLFASVSDRDGGEILQALEQLQIPVRIDPQRGTLLVPADRVYDARFRLAAQGLPRPEGETEDTPSFGLSAFQEQQRYQRALERDLAHSIESLAGVEAARVHLALPRGSAFLRDAAAPAAVAVLRLAGGNPGELGEAVRELIAGSVPRLPAERVSVLDQRGELLAARPRALQGLERVEAQIADRIRNMLGPWLGETALRVQVTISPDQAQRSVQVLLDQRRIPAWSGGEQERLETLVIQAAQLDAARGDSLSVLQLPFSAPVAVPPTSVAPAAPATPARAASPRPLLPLWWTLAAAGVLGLVLWGVRRQRRPRPVATVFDRDAALAELRQQVRDDPRRAASVFKAWMQS